MRFWAGTAGLFHPKPVPAGSTADMIASSILHTLQFRMQHGLSAGVLLVLTNNDGAGAEKVANACCLGQQKIFVCLLTYGQLVTNVCRRMPSTQFSL